MSKTALDLVAYVLDTLGFFIVTTDLYGRRIDELGDRLKGERPESLTNAKLITPVSLFGLAVGLPVLLVVLFFAIVSTFVVFEGVLSLFGIFIEPDMRRMTRVQSLQWAGLGAAIAFICWPLAGKVAFSFLAVPLAGFLAIADRIGFKRALIALGALCFIASKALSVWGAAFLEA